MSNEKKEFNYRIKHIGINNQDAEQANELLNQLTFYFDLVPQKDTLDKVFAAEEPFEVFPAHEFTAGNALFRFVILKGGDPSPHRGIIENEDVEQHRQGHDQKLPLLPEL